MSMYTTAQLLAANEKKFKFDPLFLRLFFRESYPFTTEKVYLSQIPGLVNMALYVSPIVSGEVIRSRGGSTSEFTPGYVKPKHEVNPQMTLRRLPDEDPQNLADPAYRRRRIIMQNMRDEELAIAQVEEMQAVSAVLKGKYTMTGEAFDPVADIRQVETTARYLGTALYWIAASINIRPGHNYYFYVRSVNTVGKSAFVEAVGQPSDDASGYLDFFKGEIGKTHLAQELWTQIDNGQLAPDLAEIRTSITDVSNEITQTVNKKLEDQSAAIQQIQKVQVDTNNNLNSMWAVKLQQMQDGRLYIAGIGAGIENTPDGMQSQVLLAADRIAMINPANGNTKPMFVGQGDQIFMNEVFLKYLTAPTITSGGNPPAFSLTPDGKLTAKNADISGSVNANAGTLNNVTINENCQIKGKLSANQIEGDIVKTVGKAFPRDSRAPERWPSGTITVRIYDDQPFDRQIVIPAVAFSGAKHEREHTDIYSSCRLIVKKNGAEIYNRTALDNTLIYSGVIDMPAGHGHMTLEFSVSAWLVNDWYPTASISDLLVVVMKKATAGISIS